ncbi:hypothetical protein [Desulfosporosinus sp. HMP52]|uniref:hypothetical protein n=1 Tax=Desulfosporosinus sp. HMP52 TaxID=1487923 RepID=UPI000B1AC491|nr:hypothetical protein [Desulfosporosinus sp. HMP52]
MNVLFWVLSLVSVFLGVSTAVLLLRYTVLSLFAIYNYLSKLIDISPSYFLIHPISALLCIGAGINSVVKTLSRGGTEWRGTFYPLEVLKKHI